MPCGCRRRSVGDPAGRTVSKYLLNKFLFTIDRDPERSPGAANNWIRDTGRPQSHRMDIRIQCLCIDTTDPGRGRRHAFPPSSIYLRQRANGAPGAAQTAPSLAGHLAHGQGTHVRARISRRTRPSARQPLPATASRPKLALARLLQRPWFRVLA